MKGGRAYREDLERHEYPEADPDACQVRKPQQVCRCGHVQSCHAGPDLKGPCAHHPASKRKGPYCGCEGFKTRRSRRNP